MAGGRADTIRTDTEEAIGMKNKGPILTLLAVVVLALVLLAVNLTTKSEDGTAAQTDQTVQNAPGAPAVPVPAAPAAPAASPFPAQATYTGKTSGRKAGEASVAVAVRDGKASAYLCDGRKLESWLEGQADGATLTLTGKNGGQLTGTLQDGQLTGTVSVGGLSWPYAAKPGKAPAGLYRARNTNADAGWIVYPDGQQTGVQNIDGEATPAPALDTTAGSAVLGGTPVPVQAIQGGEASTVGR